MTEAAPSADPGGGLRYAYNTNGLISHRLGDALELLADAGYAGVALTLDHATLDPYAPDAPDRAHRLRERLDELGLDVVVETGARFLLDPQAKHEPTFVSPSAAGRERRLDFLRRAVDLAAVLRAEAVSFWAGVPRPGVDLDAAWRWLVEGVTRLAEHAESTAAGRAPVVLAVEPEPGMLVDGPGDWERLAARVPGLQLALDTGHCLVSGDLEPGVAVHRYAGRLGAVAVEDMRRGVHEHLAFGEGDLDLPAVLGALRAVGYSRLVSVELSRDSHRADVMVPRAIEALRAAEAEAAAAARPWSCPPPR